MDPSGVIVLLFLFHLLNFEHLNQQKIMMNRNLKMKKKKSFNKKE